MTKPYLALVTPTTKYEQLRAIPHRAGRRMPHYEPREHLAQHELEKLIEVVKRNRQPPRWGLAIKLIEVVKRNRQPPRWGLAVFNRGMIKASLEPVECQSMWACS